jgi:hypothetical protein
VRLFAAGLSALIVAAVVVGCTYDYEAARRCTNGVRDGDEGEIDCGGSCKPCSDAAGGSGGVGGVGGTGGPSPFGGSAGVAGTGGTQLTFVWQQLTVNQEPPKRYAHALVAERNTTGRIVLFSGYEVDATETDDTWTLEGATWTKKSPATRPPARHNAMAGYDETGQRTVLAGGFSGSLFKDNWTWNGTTWSALDPLTVGLDAGGMVWDSNASKLLLFAANSSGDLQLFELAGATWQKITALVPPLLGLDQSGWAYDTERKLTVLFKRTGGETWEYNHASKTWKVNLSAGGPGARCGVAMAYDEQRKVTMLFGGANASCNNPGVPFNDTWQYDGTTWQQIPTTGTPPARFRGRMVYDALRNRMVLFGGASASTNPIAAATWIFFVLGTPCAGSTDCDHGYCVDGVCCASASCPSGQTCKTEVVSGTCQPL